MQSWLVRSAGCRNLAGCVCFGPSEELSNISHSLSHDLRSKHINISVIQSYMLILDVRYDGENDNTTTIKSYSKHTLGFQVNAATASA